MIAISRSDFNKYGCPNCGCTFAHSTMSFRGSSLATCGECKTGFVVLMDGYSEVPFTIGEDKEQPTISKHPREGLWPHDFVRPDIKPKGIDGEFWYPRGVGYDLAGFVTCKVSGERIIKMIQEVIGHEPKSWLDYRISEPLWIQVKIQKEDGFNLQKLYTACKDGVITLDRLLDCYMT